MDPQLVLGGLLLACILAMFFAVCHGIVASIRFRMRLGKATKDFETDMIRNAAKRDAYEDIARFARQYYDDPHFSSRIRQLYYTKDLCPECDGKGKKWQNSKDKCEHCWGTGKHLKDF